MNYRKIAKEFVRRSMGLPLDVVEAETAITRLMMDADVNATARAVEALRLTNHDEAAEIVANAGGYMYELPYSALPSVKYAASSQSTSPTPIAEPTGRVEKMMEAANTWDSELKARQKVVHELNNQPSEVDHPPHYNQIAGVECIEVVENFSFNIGSAMKYLWRHGVKSQTSLFIDLRKSAWYINREIQRLEKQAEASKATTTEL